MGENQFQHNRYYVPKRREKAGIWLTRLPNPHGYVPVHLVRGYRNKNDSLEDVKFLALLKRNAVIQIRAAADAAV